MDKIENEIIEDGELTSDYESENLIISCQSNDRSCIDSQSTNYSAILDKNKNLDFQNLLSDFETQIKKQKNLTNNYVNNKICNKYCDNDQPPIEEDDIIFVRGASPTSFLFSDENNFFHTKENTPFDNLPEDNELYRKNKAKKQRNSKDHSKRRNTMSKRECNEKDQNEASNASSPTTIGSTQQLKICKFYLQDKCGKTEKTCTFLHSQFPCKYYYLGLNCPKENNCKLNHGGLLSDEMKEALLLHIQIAPREILGDFKISPNHAKKLLSDRLAELASKNEKPLGINISPNRVDSENSFKNTNIHTTQTCNFVLPDLLKIEQFNDIFNETQIESLKKIGVLFSYQLLALSMIELNACGIDLMQIVKIQEKIKKSDNIKVLNTYNIQTEIDVNMQKGGENKNYLSTCVKETKNEQLLPPVISTDLLCNMEVEDCEEECDLVIDEEAFSTSDGEIEFLKHDIENKTNQNDVKQNSEMTNNENQNLQNFNDFKAMNLSKQSDILYKKVQTFSETMPTNTSFEHNKLEIGENNNKIPTNHSLDISPIGINDYAKDLRKISASISTLDDIKIITTDDLDMRLPFNSVLQNYKPATEYDGSFTPHSIIPWKLVEIMLPGKVPMSLEQIEKLQQSNDPRIRKRIVNQEIYSFDGNTHSLAKEFSFNNNSANIWADNNNNESKNKMLYKKDFADPRKTHNISNSTYEHFKQPTVMQILQHYLHRSTWYNKQNSKAKMEINELIAVLANYLKKFKQDNTPNKKCYITELKNHSKILSILNNLKIFIDSNGAILPEKRESGINYAIESSGTASSIAFGGFETFWGGVPSNQRHLPVISNLVPIGSFQAPMPLHFTKPGLLGFHPNDIASVGCNTPFQATTAAVHTSNIRFENNILFGDQNFTLNFGNCKPQFLQSPVSSNSTFGITKTSNEQNSYRNRNNSKFRNNSKLSDRYNKNKNKRFNKSCNNLENKDVSINQHNFIEEDLNNNDNFENKNINKYDVTCSKENLKPSKVSEDWDEEDENIKDLEKSRNDCNATKNFEEKEENWDTDDENDNFRKTDSNQNIKLVENDMVLKDSPNKNSESINDFAIMPKKQKLENLSCTTTEVEEKENNYLVAESSANPVNKEKLCFANNIEISKAVCADDSEEEWD